MSVFPFGTRRFSPKPPFSQTLNCRGTLLCFISVYRLLALFFIKKKRRQVCKRMFLTVKYILSISYPSSYFNLIF